MAFILNMEITPIFLTTTLFLCLNIIYKRLTLIAIYYINLPVTIFNFYLILALYPVNTTYKNKAITNIL